ncbi:MAG: hypothetical protein AAGH68_06325 [Pseudomonadota bacterium]
MSGMERICVIGNSHLGAAKHGWESIRAQNPGQQLTFFGAPWDMLSDLALEDGDLVALTEKLQHKLRRASGGLDRICTGDYDRFILYGLQFGPRRVLMTYRNFRPQSFEWRDGLEDLNPLRRERGPMQAVSERLFDRIALAGLRSTLAVRIADMIAEVSNAPVQLVAAPGFSERVLDTGDWDGPLGSGDVDRLAMRVRRLLRKACPEGVQLILPRRHLIRHGLFTARSYAAEDRPGGQPDDVHTAPAYAGEMLGAAISAGREANRSAA